MIKQTKGCDLLEKSYFCSITNIGNITYLHIRVVVICLKNRTFAVSQTSSSVMLANCGRLWFAWKIVLLQYHKHPKFSGHNSIFRCDLLEKSYFCSITNIYYCSPTIMPNVVICLKNRTFAVSQTSEVHWLAAKTRCDLLEKSYFCSITNIYLLKVGEHRLVVICLKNRTFAVSQTSITKHRHVFRQLWFAWKIVLLQYHKHQRDKDN